MTFADLAQWTIQIGAEEKLSPAAKKQIQAELPIFIRGLTPASAPSRLKLPTGESLGNATRMTALKCQCLLLARIVSGPGYVKADPEYERLAKDVLFFIMRHAFNSTDPKGVFCCPPCTLSLLPLYAASSFKWVKCDELAGNVLKAYKEGTSVFRRTTPKAYAEWSVNLATRLRR